MESKIVDYFKELLERDDVIRMLAKEHNDDLTSSSRYGENIWGEPLQSQSIGILSEDDLHGWEKYYICDNRI